MSKNLATLCKRIAQSLEPKEPVPTSVWAELEFRLAPEISDSPGPYSLEFAPYFKGIFAALDDPSVSEVVCAVAMRFGWQEAVRAA